MTSQTKSPRLCWNFADLQTPWGPIKLEQHGVNSFRVTYGLEVKDRLSYGEACAALGQAQMHWLSCESHIDNRQRGERGGFDYVAPASKAVAVLKRAEAFVSGFEDDDAQEGVPALLADLRAIIGRA